MRYTIFIFSVLYVCLLFSKVSAAAEQATYEVDVCSSSLTTVNPIEDFMGEVVELSEEAGVVRTVKTENGGVIILSTSKTEIESGKTSYFTEAVDPSHYVIRMVEKSTTLNHLFAIEEEVSKVSLKFNETGLYVEWIEVNEGWEELYNCTYKPKLIVTAKN